MALRGTGFFSLNEDSGPSMVREESLAVSGLATMHLPYWRGGCSAGGVVLRGSGLA